jgi:HlyD family secretion protein
MVMQLPLIGKIRPPAPWILGLIAAGLVGTGTAVLVIRQQAAVPDISTLTVPVESEAVTIRISASGTVQPVQTVNLSPKETGLLAELFVEQGDRVTQGQVIARMESETVEAELAQAEARVAQSRANLSEVRAGNRPEEIAQAEASVAQAEARVEEAQARVNLADERVRRNRQLEAEGAISTDDLDQVLNEAETARATLAQNRASLQETRETLRLQRSGSRPQAIEEAEARLVETQANLQAVRVRLEDTYIRAPFSGIVTQKYATPGSFVAPATAASDVSSASSTAIVAIATGLEILAEVPEVDINQISVGQPVEITADAYPNQVFEGRVKLVAPEAIIEQNVTSFQVRIDLETGEDRLLSGMNVDVEFIGDELSNALVVPTVAIVRQDGQEGVLVPDRNNRARFRPVATGSQIGNQIQILEGVEEGDRIFIDLPPGQNLDNLNFGQEQQEE